MIKHIYLFLFFFGCGSASNHNQIVNKESLELKVLDIKEYQYGYQLKTLQEKRSDTIFVISLKESLYDKYGIKKPFKSKEINKISLNESYDFIASRTKPQVSAMEELGQYYILEKDTLWQGNSKKNPPIFYTALNTIGLSINEP